MNKVPGEEMIRKFLIVLCSQRSDKTPGCCRYAEKDSASSGIWEALSSQSCLQGKTVTLCAVAAVQKVMSLDSRDLI